MRKRRKSKKKIRKKSGRLSSKYVLVTTKLVWRWLAFFGVIGMVAYVWFSDVLRISKVICEDPYDKSCNELVMAELNRLKGEHTFLVKIDELENKLMKADPSYSSVRVEVIFPSLVKVSIESKSVLAYFKIATSSAALAVDSQMQVVDKVGTVPPGEVEIIYGGIKDLGIGDVLGNDVTRFAAELSKKLIQNYISFRLIEVDESRNVWVKLTDGRLAVFDWTEDASRQVTSLQLILSKATISPEPQIIDLRFDKPVLKY